MLLHRLTQEHALMTPVKEEMERLFEEKEVKKQVSIMTYFRL